MALELIKRQSASSKPERFKGGYEAAAKELVHSQLHNRSIPKEKPNAKPDKVSYLMDALKKAWKPGHELRSEGTVITARVLMKARRW